MGKSQRLVNCEFRWRESLLYTVTGEFRKARLMARTMPAEAGRSSLQPGSDSWPGQGARVGAF